MDVQSSNKINMTFLQSTQNCKEVNEWTTEAMNMAFFNDTLETVHNLLVKGFYWS